MHDDEDTGEQEGKDIYSGFSNYMADNLTKLVDIHNNSLYTVVKEDDDGEYYLEFPPDFLDSIGWKIGDTLSWTQTHKDAWSIRKMNK